MTAPVEARTTLGVLGPYLSPPPGIGRRAAELLEALGGPVDAVGPEAPEASGGAS